MKNNNPFQSHLYKYNNNSNLVSRYELLVQDLSAQIVAVIFFLVIRVLLSDGKPSFHPTREKIISLWPFEMVSCIVFLYKSLNSFIYYLDKQELQTDNINVVPNFSFKKSETHHGWCFIRTKEEFGQGIQSFVNVHNSFFADLEEALLLIFNRISSSGLFQVAYCNDVKTYHTFK